MTTPVRILANFLMAMLILFLIHRYFIFWQGWPNFAESYSALFASGESAQVGKTWQAMLVLAGYSATTLTIIILAMKRPDRSLLLDARRYENWSAYVIRFAFWSVFLVGIADTIISSLIIEKVLANVTGSEIASKLGQGRFRGIYVHYPLIALSVIIAWRYKGLSVIWLAFLVVIAEFMIVVTRFIFSYEQAYMGDLVRFWYAALFLFASAYTLLEEGHVRVDVLYAGFRARTKAKVNATGSLLLGIPLCFTILALGLESRQSALSSPIISFEISQSAYGLFVKYLMAGFLVIFAVSMAMQFVSLFLRSSALLLGDAKAVKLAKEGH